MGFRYVPSSQCSVTVHRASYSLLTLCGAAFMASHTTYLPTYIHTYLLDLDRSVLTTIHDQSVRCRRRRFTVRHVISWPWWCRPSRLQLEERRKDSNFGWCSYIYFGKCKSNTLRNSTQPYGGLVKSQHNKSSLSIKSDDVIMWLPGWTKRTRGGKHWWWWRWYIRHSGYRRFVHCQRRSSPNWLHDGCWWWWRCVRGL